MRTLNSGERARDRGVLVADCFASHFGKHHLRLLRVAHILLAEPCGKQGFNAPADDHVRCFSERAERTSTKTDGTFLLVLVCSCWPLTSSPARAVAELHISQPLPSVHTQ